MAGPQFELQTFYRFGFFVFLMSGLEHGLRAIQPPVVKGAAGQSDDKFWKIYTSLFRAALMPERADKHINLFAFLSTLRNTIHNNAVYYPEHHKDHTYVVGERTHEFKDGKIVDVFGWDYYAEWLGHVHEALGDSLKSEVPPV